MKMMKLKLSVMTIFFAMLLGFAVMSIGTEQAFAMEGNGSEENPYQISTDAELKEFANIVNGTNGATQNRSACAKLTANIECDDERWVPIGPASGYEGIFNGNGHEISDVTASAGLFSTVARGGSVKNLTVKIFSVGTDDQEYVGGIVNENLGTIESCTVECGNIKAKNAAGSVAGRSSGVIKNCTAKIDGKIEINGAGNSHMSGGIAGNNRTGGIIKECRAYGEGSISNNNGNGCSGGIAGWNIAKIESCICEGSLKIHNNQKDYSGGIAGYNDNNIDNCLVYGDVVVGFSASGAYVGGLVGKMVSGKCSNSLYNSSQTPLNGKHPIVSMLEGGNITDCYYNTASGCRADGYGTEISDIYWLKCDSNITPTINAEDKKTFAGRDFVYSGKDVTLSYDGLADKQSVTYRVNGEEIDGNAFKMPRQETTVEARVGIAISSFEDLKKSTFYNGSEQSPGTVQCSAGRIDEGKDYIVTKYQDSKGQETTEPPTDADTYTATIRGINNYAGNTKIEFLIAKADPEITKNPEALELTYNGNDQELLIGGTATGGTISYRLSTEDESTSSEKIPTAKDAGKYDIFYKVKGDNNHKDLSEQKLQGEIKKANITITADDKNCTDLDKTAPLTWTMEDEADKWYETEKADIALVVTDDAGSVVDPKTAPEGRYTITPSWGTENKNYDATFVKGIFDTDHQYGEWTKFDAKQHQRVCENDAAHIEKEDHKWDEGKVTTPATEQAEGVKTYTCTVCKATRTETIPKTEIITQPGVQEGKRAVPAQIGTKGRDALIIGWKDVEGAEGYDVFFAKCNHKKKKWDCKVVKTIEGGKNLNWTQTGLKKGTSYKFYVRPYVMENGVKKYIGKSPMMHAYAGGSSKKYTNAKSVKIRNVKKGRLTLAEGKTFKIKASVKKLKKNKKLMPKSHVATLRYMTSDSSVATVSKSGKITAKGSGTCYIYVYAHNGVSKNVKVTVK